MCNNTTLFYNEVFHYAKHKSIMSPNKVLLQEMNGKYNIIENI